jgi:hypothetical protein
MQFTTSIGKSALTLAFYSAGLAFTFSATAEGISANPTGPAQTSKQTVGSGVPGFGLPLSSQKLGNLRGGFDTVNNDMQLSGSVANNSATNVASGNNYIAGGSFANMTGLPITVQNSGSNVLIQNATIVNVQFQ